jgi:hypothetical protein
LKVFSSEQVHELNKHASLGKFVEAMVVTRSATVADYFINYGKFIHFKGHTYAPLSMVWSGLQSSSTMELPTNSVSIANFGNEVAEYLEDNDVVVEDNDCLLQILYIDPFGTISMIDQMLYVIELLVAEYGKIVTLNLGLNFSLNDPVPRFTMELEEFPGLKSDTIRVGT